MAHERFMHVAYVLMTGNPQFAGGVPAVALQRARHMVRQGYRASIVCSAHQSWRDPTTIDGVQVYPVRPPIGRIDDWFQRKLWTRCPTFLRALESGLEAAHAQSPVDLIDLQDGPAILGVEPFAARHRVPIVFTVHGSASLNPAKRPELGRRLHVRYEKRAWQIARKVLPVSPFIGSVGAKYGDYQDKTVVVPNTVREEWLEKGAGRTFDIPLLPLRLLFLGRMAPEKRPETVLHALARIPKFAATVDFVGNGPLEDRMKALAHDLGVQDRVRFHGFVEDRERIERFLLESDAFVFPTEFEAMSVALLEAMSFGLYPIASNIAPNQFLLPNQFLFPVGDSLALADRIVDLARNPGALAAAAPTLLELAADFRPGKIYEAMAQLYEEEILPTTLRGVFVH